LLLSVLADGIRRVLRDEGVGRALVGPSRSRDGGSPVQNLVSQLAD
jgi:hypothetical protein